MEETIQLSSMKEAILSFKKGGIIIVMDDENRENEGDLIMAAEFATKEKVAFFLKYTTGILCVSLTESRSKELNLPIMVENNSESQRTSFTISCDYKYNTTTGVSASDRSETIRALANPNLKPNDFLRPGHIFPLIAKKGGLLERRGHTEASIELCNLAGIKPVGLLAELQHKDDNGEMMRLSDCYKFAKKYNLHIITVEKIVKYKMKHINPIAFNYFNNKPFLNETHKIMNENDKIKFICDCVIPIGLNNEFFGEWTLKAFIYEEKECTALVKGELTNEAPILTRIHSECLTGNVFGCYRCDCGEQLYLSMKIINKEGKGIILYIPGHEGRGIGLINKIKAYKLQIEGNIDTFKANEILGFDHDNRDYSIALAILKKLNIHSIDLITSNPFKANALKHIINKIIPLDVQPNKYNKKYLEAKKEKYSSIINDLIDNTTIIHHNQNNQNHNNQNNQNHNNKNHFNKNELESNQVNVYPNTIKKELPLQLPNYIDLKCISSLHFGIVRTMWNDSLVTSLYNSFLENLKEMGVQINQINIIDKIVPGSFELPIIAKYLAESEKVHAVICLGVVIRGDTPHFDFVCENCSRGIMDVSLKTNVPIIFGVLCCNTIKQAEERALPPSDLPRSLAITTITMAAQRKSLLEKTFI